VDGSDVLEDNSYDQQADEPRGVGSKEAESVAREWVHKKLISRNPKFGQLQADFEEFALTQWAVVGIFDARV
jgi:hypothetical protein